MVGAILFPLYSLPIRCVSMNFTQEVHVLLDDFIELSVYKRKYSFFSSLLPNMGSIQIYSIRLSCPYLFIIIHYSLFIHVLSLLPGLEHPYHENRFTNVFENSSISHSPYSPLLVSFYLQISLLITRIRTKMGRFFFSFQIFI